MSGMVVDPEFARIVLWCIIFLAILYGSIEIPERLRVWRYRRRWRKANERHSLDDDN